MIDANICTFRLDDITPDMNWDKFYRVKAIFDKYKVKPLIGVVPDNQDKVLQRGEFHEDFWEYIRSLEKDGWSIAQHGYRHLYETTDSGILGLKKASEFAGLPFWRQYEKLEAGKQILQNEGLDVKIFMAPGHTFDKKTLKALKKLGFVCVTDGYANYPYHRKKLLFVPCRASCPKLSKGIDTICLHCNNLDESDYRELENFLEKNQGCVKSFSEVAGQLWYPRRNLSIRVQERYNLILYRFKRKLYESRAVQEYLNQTYDENKKVKLKKRITGLPLLVKYMRNQ